VIQLKQAVLITGRFSGFHTGHAKLIRQAYEKHVLSNNVDILFIGIVVSPSSASAYENFSHLKNEYKKLENIDKNDINYKENLKIKKEIEKQLESLKKNPFDFIERKRVIENFIKYDPMLNEENIIIDFFPNGHIPTIKNEILEKYNINIKILFCGEDRKETYNKQKKDEELDYAVDYINRDLKDKKSGSGTQIRKALEENNFEDFKELMPDDFDDDVTKEIWDIYQEALKNRNVFSSSIISGITHIEDLNPYEFVNWLKNLYEDHIELIQKLDGTFNMSIVKDETGIYYARLSKKQDAPFTSYSLPKTPMYNALRGACKALDDNRLQDKLNKLLEVGEALDIEVLYGVQPNTIVYNLDSNYLAILRYIKTTKSRIEQIESIKKIISELKEIIVKIDNDVYYFDWIDKEIKYISEEEVWKFTVPQVFNKEILKKKNVSFAKDIKLIEDWLNSESNIQNLLNKDVLAINLIKVPKDKREEYKLARTQAENDIRNLQKQVKSKMMEYILKDINFDLGGNVQEGIVIKDLSDNSGRMTKLINRDQFTENNKRNWYYMEYVNDVILKEFFDLIADKFKIPILKTRNSLFKSISESKNKYDYVLNNVVFKYDDLDLEQIDSKLILIKINAERAQEKILELAEESKQDEILSETFKKRTLNSLGDYYKQFSNIINSIEKLEDIEDQFNLITNFIIALFNSFSKKAED